VLNVHANTLLTFFEYFVYDFVDPLLHIVELSVQDLRHFAMENIYFVIDVGEFCLQLEGHALQALSRLYPGRLKASRIVD